MFKLALVFATVVCCCLAGNIWDSCTSQKDCTVSNSMCSILSASCGHGTCTCYPGFIENSQNTACNRLVAIGQSCQSGDTCSTTGASCVNSVCACPNGYSIGPGSYKTMCILAGHDKALGDYCLADSECFAENSYCSLDSKTCSCLPGFAKEDKYNCAPKSVNDACSSDTECQVMPNQRCVGGVCACANGATKATIASYKMDYAVGYGSYVQDMACFLNSQPQAEGQFCNYSPQPNVTTGINGMQVCAYPFNCIQCSSQSSVCARVAMTMSDVSTRVILSTGLVIAMAITATAIF